MRRPGAVARLLIRVQPVQEVQTHQNVARIGSVRRADDVVMEHHVDQLRGSSVPDAQTPLKERCRGTSFRNDNTHRILIQAVLQGGVDGIARFIHLFLSVGQYGIVVGWFPLSSQMLHDRLGFFFADIGAMNAYEAGCSGRNEEHIAVAQELLGAIAVYNSALIDFRGNFEGDAAWKIGFDDSRYNIHGRTLCCQDQVNADSAGHGRKAGNGFLHLS